MASSLMAAKVRRQLDNKAKIANRSIEKLKVKLKNENERLADRANNRRQRWLEENSQNEAVASRK